MYQLRNRYNLEKRKVESLRLDGCKNPKSTWPLFRHLTFLDGHIRPRKSYKSMMKRSYNRSHNDDDDYLPPGVQAPRNNRDSSEQPMVEIKYERDPDDNDGQEPYSCGYET